MKTEDNKLPESKVPADILWDIIMYDTGKPQVLKYAINFKVFNCLSEPTSAEEVAERLDTKTDPTSRFLDMLVVLGMITKKAGKYVNTPLAEEYLVEGKTTYMGDMYVLMTDMNEKQIAQIPQGLKTGIRETALDQAYPKDYWPRLTDIMARTERAMWSYKFLTDVLEMPEFLSFRRMLDLGGSAGIFTIALVSRHPVLQGAVLDFPPVVEITKKIIQEYGLEDRIDILGADFTKDNIGSDYDLVWTSDCLNAASDKLEDIFEKVYKSMNPGGICISQHLVMSKDGISPRNAAWMIHTRAFRGLDMTLYETDISDAMLLAGFKNVESRYVKDYLGIDRVDIARK